MADDATLAADLSGGLRFCHTLAKDIERDADRMARTVLALIDELCEQGTIDRGALAARMDAASAVEAERQKPRLATTLHPEPDKYRLVGPDVPCHELIPLCRGRCCTLHFSLSRQDLDERIVKWNYAQPYIIRQRASDTFCVHSDPETRGCTVYYNRPAVCRSYDCRKDKRIWQDYEKRIPAVDPRFEPREVPVPLGPPP